MTIQVGYDLLVDGLQSSDNLVASISPLEYVLQCDFQWESCDVRGGKRNPEAWNNITPLLDALGTLAQIWASVESYPASLHPSCGNRAFKCISKAKSTSKNRMPLSGLPVNFYDPQWLEASPSHFQRGVKAEVPLAILVPHGMDCDEDDDIDMDHDRD
ncbi:hypothetical protein EDB86DRAFT_2833649 [Lactarius hatsudake]|nr:hypothetical protein EDB86DRAFT_2833649 [Lactarius hatsudake]